MLARLEESFTRISRFSADIAHELRTPLNNVLGEIEVSLNRPRSAHEYRDVLRSALEQCRRLAHMTDDMLFLARAEAPQALMTRERLDLHRELATIRESTRRLPQRLACGSPLMWAIPSRPTRSVCCFNVPYQSARQRAGAHPARRVDHLAGDCD